MRFFDISNKTPRNGQDCVIKERQGKRIEVFYHPQTWWDDSRFACHPNVVAWSPVPEHICHNPKGWLSEYRGDDLPTKSCACLVCTDKNKIVKYAYFHDGRFLGHPDVVAYMEI